MSKKIAGILILILLASGCAQYSSGTKKTGFLSGKISIGPICPVEKNPPDPNCQPTEQTYAAYSLDAYRLSDSEPGEKNIYRSPFHANNDGTYKIELPEGKYLIKRNTNSMIGSYSKIVEIKAGQTTTLNIDIDTGIR